MNSVRNSVMKRLLSEYCSFEDAMSVIDDLEHTLSYTSPVIFHCYWKGKLSMKHVYSIRSCLRHHTSSNYSVILWVDETGELAGELAGELSRPGFSIRVLDVEGEIRNTGKNLSAPPEACITYYSDFVRTILLYNYGGCWFDLDFFFLRSFDALFVTFEREVCVYEWEYEPHPNNAIYFSLIPRSEKLGRNMDVIAELNRGWGFQQARLTYDLPLDYLVLPCAWFDPDWIPNTYSFGWDAFFKTSSPALPTFFDKCFGYHWHNRWGATIEPHSPILILSGNEREDGKDE